MICAVIDCASGAQVNLIVADVSDPPPDGCRLVEIPEGYYWDGVAVVPMPPPPLDVSDGD